LSYPRTPEEIYNWVVENENLVFWILNKYFPKFIIGEYLRQYTRDEILHTAYIAVFKASKSFDSSSNAKFSTWAAGYIITELTKEIFNILPVHIAKKMSNLYDKYATAFKLLNGRIYITQTSDSDSSLENFEPWFEVVDENEDVEHKILTKVYIDELMDIIRNRFGDKYLNIFMLRYKEKLKFREIGEIYNVSRQRAEQIIKRIFKYLIENNYIDVDTAVKLRKVNVKSNKV